MNEFFERATRLILTETELRNKFPNIAFPEVLDKATLNHIGFDPIMTVPVPATNFNEIAIRNGVTTDALGNIVFKWDINSLPIEISNAKVANAKVLKWKEIQTIRDAKSIGGVYVQGKWFHTDVTSLLKYLKLQLAGSNLPTGIQWKTMDGTFTTMSPELVLEISDSIMASEISIFSTAETLRLAMENSIDPSSFEIIKNVGWSNTFNDFALLNQIQKAEAVEQARAYVASTEHVANISQLAATNSQIQATEAQTAAIAIKVEADANPGDSALALAASTAQASADAEQLAANAAKAAADASKAVADAALVTLNALLV